MNPRRDNETGGCKVKVSLGRRERLLTAVGIVCTAGGRERERRRTTRGYIGIRNKIKTETKGNLREI